MKFTKQILFLKTFNHMLQIMNIHDSVQANSEL